MDPSLGYKVPLQMRTGTTPEISAYLQFQFYEQVLYLDHEDTWPATKERIGRWVGVAKNVGDALTFWIIDEQSKHFVAHSVVHPFNKNKQIKFDPCLSKQPKRTASNGGDVMPK